MCIAILNKSFFIPKKSLKNCWDNNNHGAGIGYIDGGEIRSYHESTSFDSFYEEYKYIRAISDKPLMLHFRIATHGMGKDMLHPHEVTHGKVTLIHNGIINGLGNAYISDTREFAELLGNFSPKNVQFIDNKGVRGFAMQLLGGTNKVVLMDNRGEFRILNESLGHWDKAKDTWYSNHSYVVRQDYVWYGNTKVSNKSNYGKGQTALDTKWEEKGWYKDSRGSWLKRTPELPLATGYQRNSYNGYGTIEGRDKHLDAVKNFEDNHRKAIRNGIAETMSDLYGGLD